MESVLLSPVPNDLLLEIFKYFEYIGLIILKYLSKDFQLFIDKLIGDVNFKFSFSFRETDILKNYCNRMTYEN
jgi:hypothetical protein